MDLKDSIYGSLNVIGSCISKGLALLRDTALLE